MYAGVRLAVVDNRHNNCSAWPVLLLYIDNTTAKTHIEKGTTNTPTRWALLRIFAWLTMKSDVSINSKHIPGILNVEADILSRNAFEFDNFETQQFQTFFHRFPQTSGFEIYQPSVKLISMVGYAMRNKTLFGRLLETCDYESYA